MKQKRNKLWIQKTGIKKHPGKLHKQLGIPASKKISSKLLTEIVDANIGTKVRGHKVTLKLKRRATLAKNLRKFK
jgi:hypothetical protein